MELEHSGMPLVGDGQFKKLYHFTSFDTFVRIWLSKKLKFSSILNVNDIQESMKGISISNPSHLPVMFAFQDLITQYKQISFSLDQDSSIKGYMNTMMWGYYADKARGVCVEFDYNKLTIPENVLRGLVNYQDIPQQRTDIPDSITTIKELKVYIASEQNNLFFIKQTGWSGENEYRLVCNTLDFLDIDGAIDCVYLTSYDSDECKMVEQLVQDKVAVKYIHYHNGLLIASETKKTRKQIEKVQKDPGVLKQMSDQAKKHYEIHREDEDYPLVLNKYILSHTDTP